MTDLDASPIAHLRVRLDGTVLETNRAARELAPPEAPLQVGGHIDGVLSSGGRALYHTYLMPLLRLHGKVQEFALALAAPAGAASHEVLVYATFDAQAESPAIVMAMVPMRERRRVENELLRVQRAADSAPGMLFEFVDGPQGRRSLPYASAGIRDLFGLAPESVRESDAGLIERIHPDDRRRVESSRRAAAAAGTDWACRYRARADDSGPWAWHLVQASARRVADDVVHWHGIATDITRQHEMEHADQARDAAERANRAKSEFLARMSHELRTPLNGIIGFAQLLASDRQASFSAEQRRRLGVIEASGRRLLLLINEVLDIARIEAGRMDLKIGPVPLAGLLAHVQQMNEPMAHSAGVTLNLDCPPELQVLADAERLAQVFANLVSNAVKYNRPHGHVDVCAYADGGEVVVAVRDTGIGLTPAQREQLFQPFNRLGAEHSRTEGTGLGLAITHSLVGLMRGRIEVDSESGLGSTFSVHLPRAETAAGGAATRPAALAPDATAMTRLSGRRVIYVEDNPVNAMLMECILADAPGLALDVAPDAATALQLARRAPPDLLMIDMHLPDVDGCTALARLRELPGLSDVPAVAVSASAMPDDIERARARGFAAYWTKPLDVQSVLHHVQALLAPVGEG